MNLFSLEHKVILVTGGYGHLGQAICQGLVEAKAQVVVLGRSEEKFKQVFPEPENLHFQPCDISQSASIEKALSTIGQRFRKIDVLVNNAIYSRGQHPENMSDEDWNYGIDGVLNSVYRCIRAVIPYMKEQKRGKIINVSSMYGIVSPDFSIYEGNPFLNPPHYGAAKAGVIQLSRYFAVHLGKKNIQVNTISPGAFPSPEVQKNQEFIKRLQNKSPLGKIGQADDLKGAFVFLSSEASNFITGQNLVIDGGWTIW